MFLSLLQLQEKRKLSSHRRCEFYEEENRGYFRFRSVDDADKYVSFFKGSGKPYHENQKRPKKVCSEFVKAHLQPVVNTQPVYHFPFDPMPRSPVPTPATIITTTVQTIISTTTTPVAPRTPTTVIRQTHKHRHNHKLVTQEFSSLDTRYHRVNKQLQPQQQQRPAPKGRHTKKKAPKRQQGQKHKQQQQKLAPTSPRSRNGGQTPKKHTQKQQSERREFSGIKFLDEQALEQERLRAYAVEEEKARKRKEERMADFAMVDDYWNDDNMIGSNDEVKWGRAKTFAKRHQASAIEKQVAPARTKHSKSHSILVKRLMGKGNSSSGSVVSGELKGHWRRKPQSLLPPKRQTALSKDNYTRNINNYPDSGSVISSKRLASLTHDRLNNHHHHPTEKSRRS